ncbi:cytochrome c oxidase assembly protein [Microbacterium sp. SORGH_AS_0888]|uniref:cytochrome c oxidase assembly protein n=1 Tax=Microbacterium sp. SORGH_AS_0888 TaxID=3041791 RepID=UPI00278445FE|nr:cytochrome c oxidase assembly protein [Microbacterium sp. SORGH_AS_0888]MDQ1128624.1 putative membrane protein [Microbacterium sp. SORGH_AS_0888]
MAIGVLFVASTAYAIGIHRVRQRGGRWPLLPTLAFFVIGLGSYAVVELGFLGGHAQELRWAFTTRIALLLFVVPAGIALGQPLQLIMAAGGESATSRVLATLRSRAMRLFGNAMFATLFAALVMCLFLTPLAGVLRTNPVSESLIGVIVPLAGAAMVLPMSVTSAAHASVFLVIEFFLAFIELLIDAIPGILMRLSDTVLDGITTVTGTAPWWPNPLRDQQLSGDLLWFIAEVGDVPVILLLLLRWMRTDRHEASAYDDLSDEEYDALTRAHLLGEDGDAASA